MQYSLRRSFAVLPKTAKAAVRRLMPLLSGLYSQIKIRVDLPSVINSRWGGSAAGVLVFSVLFFMLWNMRTAPIAVPSLKESVPASVTTAANTQDAPVTKEERSTVAPSSRGPRAEGRDQPMTLEESFIFGATAPAQASQRETKVPASVTIAQAILESDWGRSGLSRKANNYFGIKARPEPGPAGVVYMDTWEVIGGQNLVMNEPFRAYHNMEESFVDHGKFFVDRPRYSPAFQYPDNPKQFAREIHKAGYATDPGYSNKLIALMDKFNLYQYDLK